MIIGQKEDTIIMRVYKVYQLVLLNSIHLYCKDLIRLITYKDIIRKMGKENWKNVCIITHLTQTLKSLLIIGAMHLFVADFSNIHMNENRNLNIIKTFLALGDSYTIGQSVDSSQRFPAQTAKLLSELHIDIPAIRYIATTGWTTTDLQTALETEKPKAPFDIVTLLIGVNDEYQQRDTATYSIKFTELLQQSVALAGNHKENVFVLSIPDYSVTPFGGGSAIISKRIREFNVINKTVVLEYGVNYIDITGISQRAAFDASLTAEDNLHPSGKQYKLWADKLAPVIYEALNKQ